MGDGLQFIEILPDEPEASRGYELLAGSSPAPWLARVTRPFTRSPLARWLIRKGRRSSARSRGRAWYAMAAAALAGFLLTADGAAGLHLPSLSVTPPLPAPLDSSYAYLGSRCPQGVACQVDGRARPEMWQSYQRLFSGTTAVGGGVWYEPVSGVVYSEELDATSLSNPEISISLVEQRDDRSGRVSFGPTIDYSPRGRDDYGGAAWRSVTVTERRGPWLITATLTGPWRRTLPVFAALNWVAAVQLPK